MKYIILLVLFVSCGNYTDVKTGSQLKYETSNIFFNQYKDQFNDDHYHHTSNHLHLENININFDNGLDDKSLGVCITYSDGTREILININRWELLPEIEQKMLLYHELGHCALNLDHDNEVHHDKHFKLSIMNSIASTEGILTEFEDEYITELFTGSKVEINEAITNY